MTEVLLGTKEQRERAGFWVRWHLPDWGVPMGWGQGRKVAFFLSGQPIFSDFGSISHGEWWEAGKLAGRKVGELGSGFRLTHWGATLSAFPPHPWGKHSPFPIQRIALSIK